MGKQKGSYSNGYSVAEMERKQSSAALIVDLSYGKAVMKYKKLRFTFICMLVLNALLLVVVSICLIIIVPNITEERRNSPQTVHQTSERSSRVKCLMIQKKLHRLYKNGQMVDKVGDNDECSMEDLLDSSTQVSNDTNRI